MADIEINQLPDAATLVGDEVIPIDQGATTAKVAVNSIADFAAVPRGSVSMPISGSKPTIADCQAAMVTLNKSNLENCAFVIYDNSGSPAKYFLVYWVVGLTTFFCSTFQEV